MHFRCIRGGAQSVTELFALYGNGERAEPDVVSCAPLPDAPRHTIEHLFALLEQHRTTSAVHMALADNAALLVRAIRQVRTWRGRIKLADRNAAKVLVLLGWALNHPTCSSDRAAMLVDRLGEAIEKTTAMNSADAYAQALWWLRVPLIRAEHPWCVHAFKQAPASAAWQWYLKNLPIRKLDGALVFGDRESPILTTMLRGVRASYAKVWKRHKRAMSPADRTRFQVITTCTVDE